MFGRCVYSVSSIERLARVVKRHFHLVAHKLGEHNNRTAAAGPRYKTVCVGAESDELALLKLHKNMVKVTYQNVKAPS